jgi:hypothetical protein
MPKNVIDCIFGNECFLPRPIACMQGDVNLIGWYITTMGIDLQHICYTVLKLYIFYTPFCPPAPCIDLENKKCAE